MGCYYNPYHRGNTISWIFHQVNSSDFALRATTGQEGWGRFCHVVYPTGKAGGHQIWCCQGFAVNDYNFTLDALALKPSGFCNVGVKLTSMSNRQALPHLKEGPENIKSLHDFIRVSTNETEF